MDFMSHMRSRARYGFKALQAYRVFAQGLGWRRSCLEQRPVDGSGRPIPWYTYPAIEYLSGLEFHESRVFEYGCGNSSLFWAERAKEVISVENNRAWAEEVTGWGRTNLRVLHHPERAQYVHTPEEVGGQFDVVVIDGRFRNDCIPVACRAVRETGMIILDNADWYSRAAEEIIRSGWFGIAFTGFGPINSYRWTTSMFIRAQAGFARKEMGCPIGGTVPQWGPED